jgi:hypothetical protein
VGHNVRLFNSMEHNVLLLDAYAIVCQNAVTLDARVDDLVEDVDRKCPS